MSGMPAWLQRALEQSGRVTDLGVGRRMRLRRCPTCTAPILTGLDADVLAWEARCDPAPLSPDGEVRALLEGRRTWTVMRRRHGDELDDRGPSDIRARPAGDGRHDVLAEHRCRAPVPADWTAPHPIPTTPEF